MVGTVHTDNEEEPHIVRPVRRSKPSAALLQHSEKAAIPSQTKAINEFRAAEAAKRVAEIQQAIDTSPTLSQTVSPTTVLSTPTVDTSKRVHIEEIFDDVESGDDSHENARTNPRREFCTNNGLRDKTDCKPSAKRQCRSAV